MKALLDANALIAAFDQDHVDHVRANAYVTGLSYFYTSPQTQGAFLRFFTRPWMDATGQRREPRMTTGTAMAQLKRIASLPKHRFLPDDVPFHQVSMRSLSGFKQWNDAYLIALAGKHSLKLATLDRKLDNMDNVREAVVIAI